MESHLFERTHRTVIQSRHEAEYANLCEVLAPRKEVADRLDMMLPCIRLKVQLSEEWERISVLWTGDNVQNGRRCNVHVVEPQCMQLRAGQKNVLYPQFCY
jgi:hypothetical protein